VEIIYLRKNLTKKKINNITNAPAGVDLTYMKNTFLNLVRNVVLIPDQDHPNMEFYPRTRMHTTTSYQQLPDWTKKELNDLYNDYFNRQEGMWEEIGLERLSVGIEIVECNGLRHVLHSCDRN